jgi:hypothetical protein
MQPVALIPWLLLAVLLAAFASKIRPPIVGWILVLAGVAVFAVRFHHEGPYPFPGTMDLAFGCAALLVGALLVASRRRGTREAGVPRVTRVLLGIAPIAFLLAALAYGHEAEEVVVLRTRAPEGSVRETRLWIVDYEGSPWIVTGPGSPHDRDLTANPRVEIVRHGRADCWMAERHLDRSTLETVLQARSDKYLAQRIALSTGMWKHFSKRDDLEEIAVALRFVPCAGQSRAEPR